MLATKLIRTDLAVARALASNLRHRRKRSLDQPMGQRKNPNAAFASNTMFAASSSQPNNVQQFSPNGSPINQNSFASSQLPNGQFGVLNSSAVQSAIQNPSNQDAEVICIVRPRDSQQTQGSVVVLERASPEFLAKLQAERAVQQQRSGSAVNHPTPGGTPATTVIAQPSPYTQNPAVEAASAKCADRNRIAKFIPFFSESKFCDSTAYTDERTNRLADALSVSTKSFYDRSIQSQSHGDYACYNST